MFNILISIAMTIFLRIISSRTGSIPLSLHNFLARSTLSNLLQPTATHCNLLQQTAILYNTSSQRERAVSPFLSVLIWREVPHGTYCDLLQRTATHCNTLQHNATHCNMLQHTATHCKPSQKTATHCNTLQHTTRRSKT